MANGSDTICKENQNTHFVSKSFFLQHFPLYEIMLKNTVELDRPQVAIQYGAENIAIWMPENWGKNTDTHSEYVTLIAF
jgi:hypothetical protein